MNEISKFETEGRRRVREKLTRELGEDVIVRLEDPQVIEVMLNPDGTLWEERHGKGLTHFGEMEASTSLALIRSIANLLNTSVVEEKPTLSGELPFFGYRFEGVIPPVTARPMFAIRKRAEFVYTLENYLEKQQITDAQYRTLVDAIHERQNILVIGGTSSGKTTFCNALLEKISSSDPLTRLALLEDVPELQSTIVNTFSMVKTDFADMNSLLRSCMRLRPDRIVIGELRDKAALDLIKAWNTGHSGGVTTIHANDAASGLDRVEALVQEAGIVPNRKTIASAINVLVSIQRLASGQRAVQDILRVRGVRDGDYVLETI